MNAVFCLFHNISLLVIKENWLLLSYSRDNFVFFPHKTPEMTLILGLRNLEGLFYFKSHEIQLIVLLFKVAHCSLPNKNLFYTQKSLKWNKTRKVLS